MSDPRNLKKIGDILNSEGYILGLFHDPKNNFYFGSFLKDGTGTIVYSVNKTQIKVYLNLKLTLTKLYEESKSFLIKHKFKNEIKTYLKDDFLDRIQCGNDLFKDIQNSMKSNKLK